jgi:hypothetical protein
VFLGYMLLAPFPLQLLVLLEVNELNGVQISSRFLTNELKCKSTVAAVFVTVLVCQLSVLWSLSYSCS